MSAKESFIKSLNSILLNKYGNSIADMAKDTGIHRNQITRYISGATSPTLETIDELAAILKVDFAQLIMGNRASLPSPEPNVWDAIAKLQAEMAQIKATSSQTLPLDPLDDAERLLHQIVDATQSQPKARRKKGSA